MNNIQKFTNGVNIGSGGTGTASGDLTVNSNKLDFCDGSTTVPVLTTTSTDTVTNKSISGSTNTITNVSLTTGVTGTLPVANGGTAVTSVTTSPTASSFAGWDASANLSADSFIAGYATTVTNNTTTTLTVDSKQQQYFTGSQNQNVVLPATSTLVLGQSFTVFNNTQAATQIIVKSSGSNTIVTLDFQYSATLTVISTSLTTAAAWAYVVNQTVPLAGTVTTVAASGPSGIATWSSAVTTSGTLTQTLSNQSAGTFLGGPTSGSAATPSFRALGASDLPVAAVSPNVINNLGLACSVGSSALTIALKINDGSTDPSAGSPVTIAFRDSTIANGDYTLVSATAATSLVVPSSATLGTTNTTTGYLYVYAINNGGTIELGISSSLYDEGTVQSSTSIGAGSTSLVTMYSTTGRSSKAIRLIGRLTNSQTTAGTWAVVPTQITLPTVSKAPAVNELILDTQNGYGSTNTLITRWTNATYSGDSKNVFTYTQNATNGDSVTVNKTGLYSVCIATMGSTGASDGSGVSLNVSSNTSSLTGTAAQFICRSYNSGVSGQSGSSITKFLTAGDVLRVHTHNGSTPQNNAWSGCRFIFLGEQV